MMMLYQIFLIIAARAGLTYLDVLLIFIVIFLGVILFFIVLVMILVLCSIEELRVMVMTRVRAKLRANSCYVKKETYSILEEEGGNRRVGCDSESSAPKKNHGFTKMTGSRYVKALVKSVEFARNDTVLSSLLREEELCSTIHSSTNNVAVASGSDLACEIKNSKTKMYLAAFQVSPKALESFCA